MWELDYKEGWAPKNWCFWTVVLEKTLESSLDSKEIQPVHPKGNQSWIFTESTDVEAEILILWLPAVKNWLIRKDCDAGKDGRQKGWQRVRGWMASPIQCTGTWANSRRWWGTGKPGDMGVQRVRHDSVTERQPFLALELTSCWLSEHFHKPSCLSSSSIKRTWRISEISHP